MLHSTQTIIFPFLLMSPSIVFSLRFTVSGSNVSSICSTAESWMYTYSDADPSPRWDPWAVAAMDRFTRTSESCGGKGMAQPLSREESAWTLALTGFIAFLGTLHWGWSSLTMHRFALGGYLLQKTKERMLLISSKRKYIYKCKGKSGWTGYACSWKV